MKIYFISGLGANCSVFDHLQFSSDFEKIYIEWLAPQKDEDLQEYAKRMAVEITDNEPFILVGLSFGGIIAQEISKFKKPEKLFLISTIKSVEERPLLFKISKATQLYKYIPISFITSDGVISYAFFRKLYSRSLPRFKEIFTYRDPEYLRWCFDKILKWQPQEILADQIFHIHGKKDPLFPIHRIHKPIPIEGGNHLMIIMKHKKINEIMNDILSD